MKDIAEELKKFDEFLAKFKEEFVFEHMPQGRAGNRWYTMKPVAWEKVADFLKRNSPLF